MSNTVSSLLMRNNSTSCCSTQYFISNPTERQRHKNPHQEDDLVKWSRPYRHWRNLSSDPAHQEGYQIPKLGNLIHCDFQVHGPEEFETKDELYLPAAVSKDQRDIWVDLGTVQTHLQAD